MLPHAKRLPTRSTDSEGGGEGGIIRTQQQATHSTQTLQSMPMQVYSHNDRTTQITQLHTSVDFFRGSQLNWAALTKEAYVIYMSVKKLSFYLDSARITVCSDHLPLKRFLEKNTLNTKVNNWAVELESQRNRLCFHSRNKKRAGQLPFETYRNR